MLMVIDIGNSEITIGVYKNKELLFVFRLETDSNLTTDQLAIELNGSLAIKGYSFKDIKNVAISSVVQTVSKKMIELIKNHCNISPIVVSEELNLNFKLKIDEGQKLGADLIAGAVGVVESYELPSIIFDFGTATTISVIDKDANFIGAVISPGIKISCDALCSKTGLPYVELSNPKTIIGKNTQDAMLSGTIYGAASFVDGMAQKIEEEIGKVNTIVLTGGLCRNVDEYIKSKHIVDTNLILEGLRIISNINPKNF